jgi:WhiB family redox-sensing transcriptional regulator
MDIKDDWREYVETIFDWQKQAACKETEISVWFGYGQKKAKEICSQCPVKMECLEYQLQFEEQNRYGRYGIYGGLTPAEREQLSRQDSHAA